MPSGPHYSKLMSYISSTTLICFNSISGFKLSVGRFNTLSMSLANGDVENINGGQNRNGTSPGSKTDESIGDENNSFLQKISGIIIGTLQNGFARLGLVIGTYPVQVIVVCVVLSGLSGVGLIHFREETRREKLWVADGAKIIDDKEWIDEHFPSDVIREHIISTAGNILQASKIQALMDIYQRAESLRTSSGIILSDVCVRAGPHCIVKSILEVWAYNDTIIRALTDAQVVIDINTITVSALYGTPIELDIYLSRIERDPDGNVASAKATLMAWLTKGNKTILPKTESWENKFISMGERGHSELSDLYVIAGRSAEEEAANALQKDMGILSGGYVLVVLFVFSVMGNYNRLEQRTWMTVAGFVCIGASLLITLGLGSAFQLPYGPLHSVLPFLLLAIGVDDMFVIVASLNNLNPEEKLWQVPDVMSEVLRHAGVAVTVTSLTDFVAFLIGATTIIPGLKTFCIYSAIGILALYVLQATLFTACLTLDLKRQRAKRDGCFFCIKLDEYYKPSNCSQKQFVPWVFKKGLARVITKLPFKVVIFVWGRASEKRRSCIKWCYKRKIFAVLVTLTLFAVNVWGLTELKHYFNPALFIPDDSYASEYLRAQDRYFSNLGYAGFVYCGEMPYYTLANQFHKLNELMVHSPYIINGSTDSWFVALNDWLATTNDPSVMAMLNSTTRYPSSEEHFLNLTYKLTKEMATRTESNIIFGYNSTIKASRFPYTHIALNNTQEEIDAMDDTIDLILRAGLSSKDCFPYSVFYPTWETNKVIKQELFRNLGLAMACVFIVGLILIANVITSCLVFIGVIFTVVDVAGSVHFWDLTIDTVTSVVLVLSIGLAVDYSAHIGHMFMRVTGTRKERVKETIREIGPPVFFGGFSTLLAFILLAFSNSHAFRTFYK